MDDISSTSYHTSLNSSIITTLISIPLEQPSFHILNLFPASTALKNFCISFLFSSFVFLLYSLYLAWVAWSVASTTFCHCLQFSPFWPCQFLNLGQFNCVPCFLTFCHNLFCHTRGFQSSLILFPKQADCLLALIYHLECLSNLTPFCYSPVYCPCHHLLHWIL